jgi:hypothetical protein
MHLLEAQIRTLDARMAHQQAMKGLYKKYERDPFP